MTDEIEVHDLYGLPVRRHPKFGEWQRPYCDYWTPESGWSDDSFGGEADGDWAFFTDEICDLWALACCEREFPAPRTVTLHHGEVWTFDKRGTDSGKHCYRPPPPSYGYVLEGTVAYNAMMTLDIAQNGPRPEDTDGK